MKPVLLTPAHLDGVAELESLVFHAPWSARALELLCQDNAFGVACVDGQGRVLAYGGMMTVLDEGQITNIATHPDHRRRGLGKAVVQALLEEAARRGLCSVVLEVRESNLAAISLYEAFGFTRIGRRKDFYSHPTEAALILQKTLPA